MSSTLIIGATSALACEISEQLAQQGQDLFLVASDKRDLEAIANDLSIRYNITVHYLAVDLIHLTVQNLYDVVLSYVHDLMNIFYIAGVGYPEIDTGSISDTLIDELTYVNYLSPVKIFNAFLPIIESKPDSHIVAISSVATSRPRKFNAVYAASKKGLEFYLGTLRHYLSDKPCAVQYYKLGYMRSRLMGDRSSLIPKANPEQVASYIMKQLGKKKFSSYYPRKWFFIMQIYKKLPWFIYKRLKV